MPLRAGAETVVHQCLEVQDEEQVVLVNDATDEALIDALLEVMGEATDDHEFLEYEERERHGAEPPEEVAAALQRADVFIAPTQKSLSHTQARKQACAAGARGATMPGITREVWTGALDADYARVAELCKAVDRVLQEAESLHITTPSGTDLQLDVHHPYYMQDTGIIHEAGAFGNLPAGETFGAPINAEGELVVDHFPFAPRGTRIEIRDNEAVAVEHPDGEESELAEAFDEVAGARNVAEVGIGTNPAATLIGNVLQDEKVLGTVHVAFGDNASMVPDGDGRQVACDVHWDTVCEDPTVIAGGETLIEAGEPRFL